MEIDLHMHSKYSYCSNLDLEVIRKIYNKKGITPIITDHNTIKGNKKFRCKILGEEIKTIKGDICALFIQEEIKPLMTVEETLDEIKKQDGIAIAVHPFDKMRGSSLGEITFRPDAVEVFNARVLLDKYNKKALEFANKHNFLKTASSDAHFKTEIGQTYTIMEDFNSKKEFLKNLEKAQLVCGKTNYLTFFKSAIRKRLL